MASAWRSVSRSARSASSSPRGDLLRSDLRGLEAQQVDPLGAQTVVTGDLRQATRQAVVLAVERRDPVEDLLRRGAAALVEPAALQPGLEKAELLALRMDANELRSDLAQ